MTIVAGSAGVVLSRRCAGQRMGASDRWMPGVGACAVYDDNEASRDDRTTKARSPQSPRLWIARFRARCTVAGTWS